MPHSPLRPSALPPVRDGALDELLATGQLPDDAAPGLRPVVPLIAALQAGPSGNELAGRARALASFRAARIEAARPHRSLWRRSRQVTPVRPWVTPVRPRVSARLAAVAATVAVVVGTGAAVYVGAPGRVQKLFRIAPAPAARGSALSTGGGIAATSGSVSLSRLCAAYRQARTHGSAAAQAAARRKLLKGYGGSASVVALCPAPRPAVAYGAPWSLPAPGSILVPSQHPGKPAGHQPGDGQGEHQGKGSGRGQSRGDQPGTRGDQPGQQSGGAKPGALAGVHPKPHHGQRPGKHAEGRPGGSVRHLASSHRASSRLASSRLAVSHRAISHPAPSHRAISHRAISHREAACGSSPGTRAVSRSHPSALSGQRRGC